MNTESSLRKCLSFIDCQLAHPPTQGEHRAEERRHLAVTISRQTGAGGHSVGMALAEYLQKHAPQPGSEWTLFDRNLMEKVLEDHHLPARLAQYLPEDRNSAIADVLEDLLGLHPPTYTVLRQTSETVLRLAEMGNVILVGRGAAIITRHLPQVFHVRLVGSQARRIERVMQRFSLSEKEAAEFIAKEDIGRGRYLKTFFKADIDDPLNYHLTLNTDFFTEKDAARVIGDIMISRVWAKLEQPQPA